MVVGLGVSRWVARGIEGEVLMKINGHWVGGGGGRGRKEEKDKQKMGVRPLYNAILKGLKKNLESMNEANAEMGIYFFVCAPRRVQGNREAGGRGSSNQLLSAKKSRRENLRRVGEG